MDEFQLLQRKKEIAHISRSLELLLAKTDKQQELQKQIEDLRFELLQEIKKTIREDELQKQIEELKLEMARIYELLNSIWFKIVNPRSLQGV